ncbi:hypothetical protein MNBD_GAMMA12-2588 [hydrothermal vent metagenome]|uniref:Glycosyltransferase family 28 N-terminal domain-containing protein n=1 Tax=hydrothermal vent metagenome TaxID=652676 RepID=A0A3B0Y7S8_9ZZZZ
MKILLMSIGTRGDIEPFLAIAEILQNKGHHVICAFPEQFRILLSDSSIEFISLGKEYIELLDTDFGKAAMGGGGSSFTKLIAYIKFGIQSKTLNRALILKQHTLVTTLNPDRIIYRSVQ